MSLLVGRGITVRFGGLIAVDRVDLHVDPGEIVGLIGPNGAGKTTLFNTISGALKPTDGTIHYRGTDITGMRPDRICHLGIARTFQSSKVFSGMSVADNLHVALAYGSRSRSLSRDGVAVEIDRILELVGMPDARDTLADDLSLARQRRLEIAQAIATDAELLLLDEALAGLTPTELTSAIGMIEGLRDNGLTILMIEHVMQAIMSICDRLVVCHFGQKIAEGTPEVVAADPQVRAVYLGTGAGRS